MRLSGLITKINKLEPKQVAILIAIVGVAVFSVGLVNPFQNDDTFQIVINPPVHSIKNIVTFFESSTFYDGQKLTGVYYRPLMTTVFSVLYTMFGPHPIAYHLVQLALYIASACLLYLVFKKFMRPVVALTAALVFLVHPLNSQVVYSIPTMQDALFFFFGILAIWLLIQETSFKWLLAAAGCLFLAMLSKEAGFVFIIMSVLYLIWFDPRRLKRFLPILLVPIGVYLALKLNAVGINHVQRAAPIDSTNLIGRLYTAPSIMLFYFSRFVFPWQLAANHYWVNPRFSIEHVLIPIIIDLLIIGIFAFLGRRVRQQLPSINRRAYYLFAAWAALGIIIYLQVVPLDMTASETWFYFAMAGVLGMLGIALPTIKLRLQAAWLLLAVGLLIAVFGIRSSVRGLDYRSQYILARHDMVTSPGNYSALNNISQYYIDHHDYQDAVTYARRSIAAYPVVSNYNNLGVSLEESGDYPGAVKAYSSALTYNDLSVVYENLSLILMIYSDPTTANHFFQKGLAVYPHDYKLLVYYSLFLDSQGENAKAKPYISRATKYGSVPAVIYNDIMHNQPISIPILGRLFVIQ